jgi:flavin-dependent dehydrogenase
MNSTHDLAIVGAGPAGSAAAIVAARAGLKVLLLDKSSFPRGKICGDCLNPRTWDVWEELGLTASFKRLPHAVQRSLKVSWESEDPIACTLPDGPDALRAVSRTLLDAWLLKETRAAGAEIVTSATPTISISPLQIETFAGTFIPRLLIGADGRNSSIARKFGLQAPPLRDTRTGWQTTLPASFADTSVHMRFFREGYAGLARFSETEANFCMVLNDPKTDDPDAVLKRVLPGAKAAEWRTMAPIRRSENLHGIGNVVLAGDAWRVVEPFTGEGIYLALKSGIAAGRAAVKVMQQGEPLTFADRYAEQLRTEVLSPSWVNPFSRWLGSCPPRARPLIQLCRLAPGTMSWMTRFVAG